MIGRDFITAGNATFTISGREHRFTFKCRRKDPEPGSRYTQATYFVSLLNGPDNTTDYCYLGILDIVTGYVRLTRGSKLSPSAPSVKAIQWALPRIWAQAPMPPAFEIRHEGRCGRCGRELTVPESVDTGFGPECADLLGKAWEKKPQAKMVQQADPGLPLTYGPNAALFAVAFEEARR